MDDAFIKKIAQETIKKHAASPLTSMPEFWERIVRTILTEARSCLLMHVVMGNDYPAAVFDTLKAAEAFCVKKRKEGSGRIYWRVCDFPLNDER